MEDDPDYDPSTAEDSSEDEEYDSSMVTLDELCHSVALVRNPQTFTPPDGKKVVVEFVDTAIPNSIQCNDASVAVASENVLESCSFMNDGHLSSVDLNPNVMEIGVPNLMDYNICDLPIIIADVSPNCDTQCNEENECPNIFGGPCNILNVPESVGETETEGSKRKRAIAPQPEKWTKNETKEKRLKGHTYLGFRRADKTSTKKILQDTMRDAKQMGPACQNGTCIKYQSRSCREIEDGQRQRLFTDFWNIGSWGEKRMFINSLVKVALPKERKVEGSRRGKTFIYHLKVGDKQLPVCRPMFLNTFGLKWSTVKRWLADYSTIGTQNNQPPSSEEPSNSHQTEVNHELPSREPPSKRWTKLEMMKFLDKFFEKLPKLPSHYCRQSSSKEYLQTDLKSVSQLYDLYKQHCQTDLFSRALRKKPNDPQVIDIRSLLYDPAGKIMFKLIHGDGEEWKPLPRRPKQRSIHSMEAFPKLLREKIKLKKDKYDDLQDLKKFLPEDCRQYYSYLPHEDESIRKAKKKKAQQETAQNKNRKRSYL
ncbi:hypothetical protein GE061_005528 [Apolygus lucorum]|uniref:Uncharacterized protein n=1 Tax=Apolygus lucorum TaxID=248454 RepID=A0A8S9WYA8_APOLU|nr:hypothetical protein GE061_005528 [Apolygus lucorum]